jgi:hypothetical protein
VGFEFISLAFEQALPVVLRRNNRRPVVRRLRLLVGHLEEEQERNLLRVRHVRKAVIAQHMREVPSLVDDLLGVVAHAYLRAFRTTIETPRDNL